MEEKQNYVPKILFSRIDGNELKKVYKTLTKNKKISDGLNASIKEIGRPSKISEEAVKRAYDLWKQKKITQKQIAKNWNVSERTVRRRLVKYNK